MEQSLSERLDILVSSNQISNAIKEHVEKFAKSFESTYHIQLTEDNAGAFVTHFAIACSRLQKGEAVQESPESIQELVRRYSEEYKQAQTMFTGVAENPTEAEIGFLTMYLCLLFGKE